MSALFLIAIPFSTPSGAISGYILDIPVSPGPGLKKCSVVRHRGLPALRSASPSTLSARPALTPPG